MLLILAATSPTTFLSIPETVIFVPSVTVKVVFAGAVTFTGCEKPTLNRIGLRLSQRNGILLWRLGNGVKCVNAGALTSVGAPRMLEWVNHFYAFENTVLESALV